MGLVVAMATTWRTSMIASNQQQMQQREVITSARISSLNKKQKDPSSSTTTQGKRFPKVACKISTPSDPSPDTAANGVIRITLRTDACPLQSQVFLDLVQAEYYTNVFIFRVLNNFVAQWGKRTGTEIWNKLPPPDKNKHRDDASTAQSLSNTRGTLTFAGGNPATRQVFVNLNDANVRLDKQGMRPFATLDDDASMDILDRLYTGYKDGEGQIQALKLGHDAMLEHFPRMSIIEYCRIIQQENTVLTTT